MGDLLFSFLLVSTTVILCWILRIFYVIWWKPMTMQRYLRKHGIKGPPYRLLYGNLKENVMMSKEARSKPMSLSHRIVPRVLPFLFESVNNYGRMSVIWLGKNPRVTIMDPQLIKEILSNKFGHFEKPKVNPLVKLLVTGVADYDGEKWAKHRRIITPAFHLEKLKKMLPAFSISCSELISRWEMSVGCELDVWPEIQNLTGDVISRTAFGSSYEEGRRIFQLQKEQGELAMEAFQNIYIPGFRFLPTKKNIRRKEIEKEVRDLLRSIIEKREKAIKIGEANNDDLLGLLVEANFRDFQEHGSFKNIGMTTEEVIEECKLFYLAGQETTSTLLTWTMIVLSMHPSWQLRAREEVLQVFGERKPDFDGLNHLKTVTMILHEVLRLYPPVINLVRSTYKSMKLGHISFPPGVQFSLPTLLIHHDPELWGKDADEFKPERFSEGVSKASKHPCAFFPFGWGPRICIGQGFAIIEAKMALAMILQSFTFELSPSYTHAPFTVVTLQPQYGAQIILHKL
eukprot:TRINITY_DN337_c0_g1_i11.p1 TRINITY_DN337_c0_g1~~TRINITY_DN337_c0_g1_i11.p1  ORF type:complete len:514 (-),score=56.25 TRINITY_DN337_c0_g1_i11:277-1818(-)